jgi:hypothetical protein
MEYSIEYSKIIDIIKDEASREGAQAYSEDGDSLYDAFLILSRDEAKMKRMMSEVLASIKVQCNRFLYDLGYNEDDEEPDTLTFEVEASSRRINGKELALKTVFRSLTVNLILNKFFVSRNMTDLAAKYDAMALSDVQSLNKLLFEKMPPSYSAV